MARQDWLSGLFDRDREMPVISADSPAEDLQVFQAFAAQHRYILEDYDPALELPELEPDGMYGATTQRYIDALRDYMIDQSVIREAETRLGEAGTFPLTFIDDVTRRIDSAIPVLEQGDTGPYVEQLQTLLLEHRHVLDDLGPNHELPPLEVNGIFDAATHSWLLAAQQAAPTVIIDGMVSEGRIRMDSGTLAQVDRILTSRHPQMELGDNYPAIQSLQELLIAYHDVLDDHQTDPSQRLPEITPNGQFDEATKTSVEALQRLMGEEPTGRISSAPRDIRNATRALDRAAPVLEAGDRDRADEMQSTQYVAQLQTLLRENQDILRHYSIDYTSINYPEVEITGVVDDTTIIGINALQQYLIDTNTAGILSIDQFGGYGRFPMAFMDRAERKLNAERGSNPAADLLSSIYTAELSLGSQSDLSASQEPQEVEYVVQSGDSWSRIAQNFNMSARELAAFNDATISTMLHPDQRLRIPGDNLLQPEHAPASDTPQQEGNGVSLASVVSGIREWNRTQNINSYTQDGWQLGGMGRPYIGDVILTIANAELGRGEDERGNNLGPDIQRYMQAAGWNAGTFNNHTQEYNGRGPNWCAGFVSYVMQEAGISPYYNWRRPRLSEADLQAIRDEELTDEQIIERFPRLRLSDAQIERDFYTNFTQDALIERYQLELSDEAILQSNRWGLSNWSLQRQTEEDLTPEQLEAYRSEQIEQIRQNLLQEAHAGEISRIRAQQLDYLRETRNVDTEIGTDGMVMNLRTQFMDNSAYYHHLQGYIPDPGDIIFFDRGARDVFVDERGNNRTVSGGDYGGHIGFVVDVEVNEDGTLRSLTTIEGNKGRTVRTQHYTADDLERERFLGFGSMKDLVHGNPRLQERFAVVPRDRDHQLLRVDEWSPEDELNPRIYTSNNPEDPDRGPLIG